VEIADHFSLKHHYPKGLKVTTGGSFLTSPHLSCTPRRSKAKMKIGEERKDELEGRIPGPFLILTIRIYELRKVNSVFIV
jgi:hypothetical protein